MLVQIKHRFTLALLGEAEAADTKAGVVALVVAGTNLNGANLFGMDLSGANLRGAKFQSTDMRTCNLQRADLTGATMNGADLREADFRQALLQGTDFTDADLRSADLGDVKISGGTFGGAKARPPMKIARDAVGQILTDTATVQWTYADTTPAISADVKDSAITFAKMQNLAASVVVGRGSSGGTGSPQPITLGSSLAMSGTALQRAALTGDVTAGADGNATTIANLAVTAAKIAANTVTLAKIERVATNQVILSQGVGADAVWTGSPSVPTLTTTTSLVVGSVGSATGRLRWGAAVVANGGTIAHGLGVSPGGVWLTGSVAGEMVAFTGLDATNITVGIVKHDGTGGTTQNISWMVVS